MARAVAEWVGKSDDDPVPPRVRARVWERFDGRCHRCTRKILVGEKWTCEHLTAIINKGPNREGNLTLTCSNCLPAKNAEDVAEKKIVARIKAKHLGIAKPKQKFTKRVNPWRYAIPNVKQLEKL